MNLTINIKQGLGNIHFQMPVEEVVRIMGTADEVEDTDNAADEPTTVLHYNDLGITLFFEGENPMLACIDVCNDECTLFGKEIFDMDEREIVSLMVSNNYTEQDVDDEDWGERRISFSEGNIDFYLEDGELMSITIGQ